MTDKSSRPSTTSDDIHAQKHVTLYVAQTGPTVEPKGCVAGQVRVCVASLYTDVCALNTSVVGVTNTQQEDN